MNRNRGFAAPIVLLLTFFFLILPIVFWYYANANSMASVKGATITKKEESIPVKIVSPGHTWDLQQYLCKDKKECSESLYSGKRYTTTSGGSTPAYYVDLSKPETAEEYKFVKVFAHSSSGNKAVKYQIQNSQLLSSHSIEIVNVKEGDLTVDAVLIPLEFFSNTTGAIESIDFISE